LKQFIKVSYRAENELPELDKEIQDLLKTIGFHLSGAGFYFNLFRDPRLGKRDLNFERRIEE
jgi:predicted nucleic acid-binding Zn ribbon protein